MNKSAVELVSVIIPVYNDPSGIETTLKSVCYDDESTYVEREVIVVDNDSTDETKSVVQEYVERFDYVSLVHEIDIQSSYAARNTGFEHSSGDVLLFLDADIWTPKMWLEDMISALESNSCDYLGCNVEVVADDQPNVWERYEQSFSFPVKTYLKDKQFAPTCALAVRRGVFEKVGLFDERLESGGDKEFGRRVSRAGFKQGYAGDVTVFHPARESWQALRSKAFRIGRGRAQKRRYHPELGDPHPLHPINYLPPSPFRLRRRFSGQDVSLLSPVGFYLLEYVLKLTQIYGMVRETLTQRRLRREEP